MKSAKTLFYFWFLFLILCSCNTAKETTERQNFMMPHRSELRRNDKYVPSKPKKTYSNSKKQKQKKKKKNKHY
jgi:hypothetical protein